MSAILDIQRLSDCALQGAIDQLAISGEWPVRLNQLRREYARRKNQTTNKRTK